MQAAAQQPATEWLQLGPAPTRSGRPRRTGGRRGNWPATFPSRRPTAGLRVDPAHREASRTFFITYYQNAAAPAHGWTGDLAACDAGTTSAAFRDAVLLRINYFRAMAGVPAQVTLSDTYNAKAQQAALMMSVNDQLSHNPPATWHCYTADGAEAAGNSNLALGIYGWDAITGYMQDPGTGNGAVGHRRWILYPQTQTMGTGDIPPTRRPREQRPLGLRRPLRDHQAAHARPLRRVAAAGLRALPGGVPALVVLLPVGELLASVGHDGTRRPDADPDSGSRRQRVRREHHRLDSERDCRVGTPGRSPHRTRRTA